MELQEKIAQYVESLLEEGYFLVEVIFNDKGGGRPRLTVLLDGDKGINIDQCASVSRRLAAWLEEQDLIKTAYLLEVSSPGIGQPLKLLRQYYANIGRTLKVETVAGITHKGRLEQVAEDALVLAPLPVKKPKKAKAAEPEQPVQIPFAHISKAVVEISFD
ncbi:ribosome maturation factor RimP [Rhodoflexus sp.]